MSMEFKNRRQRDIGELYPEIPREKVKQAELYFQLIIDGKIGNPNTSREKAAEDLERLRQGKMADYVITSHASDYMDYINQ